MNEPWPVIIAFALGLAIGMIINEWNESMMREHKAVMDYYAARMSRDPNKEMG